jgi:DNA polymerase/3'-5' exonuclease PolX
MPSRDYPAVQGPPPDNAEIARQLDAFASLLELAGSGPYTGRAYRRAAELIRSTPVPVAELVREGRARELRGIGPGIDRRLRELVETGEIEELRELERDVSPELAWVGRFLGVSVKRMLEIGRVLGVRTLEELREAAQEGRLREVPGVGPETERKLLAALAREPRATTARPLLLHRSRPLVESIAEALGGVAAGDPRRWVDASERLAVVVAAEQPEPVLDQFEALPQIASEHESDENGAVIALTVELPKGQLEALALRVAGLLGGPSRRWLSRRRRRWLSPAHDPGGARALAGPADGRAALGPADDRAGVARRPVAGGRRGRAPRRDSAVRRAALATAWRKRSNRPADPRRNRPARPAGLAVRSDPAWPHAVEI